MIPCLHLPFSLEDCWEYRCVESHPTSSAAHHISSVGSRDGILVCCWALVVVPLHRAIFPSASCPSLTGSVYIYSLKVTHLALFPITVTNEVKQTSRPTPSAQPLVPAVPEKAFIHSHRWYRQTYSLSLCTVVLYGLSHVNLEDADLLILYLNVSVFLGLARLYGALVTRAASHSVPASQQLDFQRTKNANIVEEGKVKHEHPENGEE